MSETSAPAKPLGEIRLRWDPSARPGRGPGGHAEMWVPDSEKNRKLIADAVSVGNQIYGERTHWIEAR